MKNIKWIVSAERNMQEADLAIYLTSKAIPAYTKIDSQKYFTLGKIDVKGFSKKW